MTIAWAWPKPLSYGGRRRDLVPAGCEPGHASRRERGPRSMTVGPAACRPRVEPGDRARAAPSDRRRRPRPGDLAVVEQARRELQQDLRLGVAAHRAEHRAKRAVGASPSPGTACAAAGGRAANSAGWPSLELKPEAAVVQVDPGVRLDQPRAEARRVRLDQRHAHALAVDRAQVGRVAVAPGAHRFEARSVSIMSIRCGDGLQQRVAVGGVAEHVGTVEAGGRRRLDQQVRPADVVGVGRQIEPTRPARRRRA